MRPVNVSFNLSITPQQRLHHFRFTISPHDRWLCCSTLKDGECADVWIFYIFRRFLILKSFTLSGFNKVELPFSFLELLFHLQWAPLLGAGAALQHFPACCGLFSSSGPITVNQRCQTHAYSLTQTHSVLSGVWGVQEFCFSKHIKTQVDQSMKETPHLWGRGPKQPHHPPAELTLQDPTSWRHLDLSYNKVGEVENE